MTLSDDEKKDIELLQMCQMFEIRSCPLLDCPNCYVWQCDLRHLCPVAQRTK